ncbi:MAG TPA: hypothetical protein VF147_15535 [Vicinamibacterales bacterium]
MSETTVDVTLTAREWELISTLREIPPSPLRNKVASLIDELVAFIRDPKCAEMQGDGVPCDNVSTACAQCVHVAGMLESMDRVGALKR